MMRIVPHLNKFHFVDINKNVYNLVRYTFQIISKPFLVHKEEIHLKELMYFICIILYVMLQNYIKANEHLYAFK